MKVRVGPTKWDSPLTTNPFTKRITISPDFLRTALQAKAAGIAWVDDGLRHGFRHEVGHLEDIGFRPYGLPASYFRFYKSVAGHTAMQFLGSMETRADIYAIAKSPDPIEGLASLIALSIATSFNDHIPPLAMQEIDPSFWSTGYKNLVRNLRDGNGEDDRRFSYLGAPALKELDERVEAKFVELKPILRREETHTTRDLPEFIYRAKAYLDAVVKKIKNPSSA